MKVIGVLLTLLCSACASHIGVPANMHQPAPLETEYVVHKDVTFTPAAPRPICANFPVAHWPRSF